MSYNLPLFLLNLQSHVTNSVQMILMAPSVEEPSKDYTKIHIRPLKTKNSNSY